MRKFACSVAFALALGLAACGEGPGQEAAPDGNEAGVEANAAQAGQAAEAPALPPCPFRATRWRGWVEGGRVRINGNVDLQMAGFRPTLTERPGAAPGTVALDLSLAPEPQAAVTDLVQYEGPGAGRRRAEIWCGGERIETVDLTVIG